MHHNIIDICHAFVIGGPLASCTHNMIDICHAFVIGGPLACCTQNIMHVRIQTAGVERIRREYRVTRTHLG